MVLLHSEKLPLRWHAPDFSLRGTDDKAYSLGNFADKKGLLVIFTCNHCPYAIAAWPLTVDLYNKFGGNAHFVAINPNDPNSYPDDSFENMKKLITKMNVPFPYLVDDTQEIAKSYKAQCTPDLYLFKKVDDGFLLFYHGRINDN